MLPPGFEPGSKPREGLMIGHYTTGAKNIYPPEETWIIVSSCPSFILSSIGKGLSFSITITVSGFRSVFLRTSFIVAPSSAVSSFVSLVRDSFILIFT